MVSLRPYQTDAVRFFMTRPDKRAIFAHATSAGKTLSAIMSARAMGAQRILVVCPALARPTWAREFQKWAPELIPHPIRFGRTRSSLTKAQIAERDAAYAASVQVVSYKLITKDFGPHDLLILDELHALRNPLSKQAKAVRAYRAAHNPAMLGLTATLIPTEVRQLWCPLDTFWPGQWGRKHPAGDVSWDFQSAYCYRQENEHGVKYVGSKSPEALLALAGRLQPFVHRVTDAEVAPFLPPLHAEPLYLDERRAEADVAAEWYDDVISGGARHVAVICYNRETAWDIAAKLDTENVITGELSIERRDALLEKLRREPSSTFVATCESVREALSLSFVQRALILQWRTSPAQAIQLMGRFPRQDAEDLTRPSHVQYVVGPGDEARAELLTDRIKDIQQILKADRKSEQLVELFKARELTEEQIEDSFLRMLRSRRDHSEWEDSDDTE